MSPLTKLALLAYPRSFRDVYGAEWSRTVRDLRVHRGLSTARMAWRVVLDVLTTAPRMRWESLMARGARLPMVVVIAVIAGAGLWIGSPAVAVPVFALVAIAALLARRHDQPITAELRSWSARWYLWLVAGAVFFLIGYGAALTEGDRGLATAVWATWALSWLAGALLGVIGLGLGATRLIGRRRT